MVLKYILFHKDRKNIDCQALCDSCGFISELEKQTDVCKTLALKAERVSLYFCLPALVCLGLPLRVSRSWSEAQSPSAGAEDGSK